MVWYIAISNVIQKLGRSASEKRGHPERDRGAGRQYSRDTAARGAVLHGAAV